MKFYYSFIEHLLKAKLEEDYNPVRGPDDRDQDKSPKKDLTKKFSEKLLNSQ